MVAAVVSTRVMIQGVLPIILEVRARRHGTAICARTGELMARHLRGGRAQDGFQARNTFVTWLSSGAGEHRESNPHYQLGNPWAVRACHVA